MWTCFFISLGSKITRSEIVWPDGPSKCLTFLRNCWFFNVCIYHVIIPPAMFEGSDLLSLFPVNSDFGECDLVVVLGAVPQLLMMSSIFSVFFGAF